MVKSAYTCAYDTICSIYLEKQRPLNKKDIQVPLEVARGVYFEPGTTLEDVLIELSRRKLIVRFVPKGQREEQIVPLEDFWKGA